MNKTMEYGDREARIEDLGGKPEEERLEKRMIEDGDTMRKGETTEGEDNNESFLG